MCLCVYLVDARTRVVECEREHDALEVGCVPRCPLEHVRPGLCAVNQLRREQERSQGIEHLFYDHARATSEHDVFYRGALCRVCNCSIGGLQWP